jgi:hypothetical protein
VASITAPSPTEHDAGVSFPLLEGARSTSRTGRAVLADAARMVDTRLAAAITSESDWRKTYPRHVRRLVEAELSAGHGAVGVPPAGLTSLHHRFVYAREGDDLPLHEALRTPSSGLETAEVHGRGRPADRLTIPYHGQRLSGDALHRHLDAWVAEGVVEPALAEAVRRVMAEPDWRDLSDRTMVILGAGAEMGPLTSLCSWGADLALVDLPGSERWDRILATVRAGAGTARIPLQRPGGATDDDRLAADAGADLLTQTPELRSWLAQLAGPMTIGNYVYADGADNVRVSVAADALTADLAAGDRDVSLAVLLTPTDVYAAPEEAVEEAQARFARVGTTLRLLRRLSGERLYARNYDGLVTTPDGHRFGIADCLVTQQGPNYALAKRLQQWRARAARDEGHVVSANVAPATSTRSVTKNRILAAAYAGAPRFGVEVFEPATSNALMAALLVHDLRNPDAPGHPDTELSHPLELFSRQAGHGGMWRNPFSPRSVLTLAALGGLLTGG